MGRVWPDEPGPAMFTVLVLTGVLYVLELLDAVVGTSLDRHGIRPHDVGGLMGIIWAPFLHLGWDHLLANTVPFLVFGFLVQSDGFGRFLTVTATIWIISGVGVWVVGDPRSNVVGASGVCFGWLTYLLARGFFARSATQIVVAVLVFAVWGSVLWGVLPQSPRISWQGHLFGAVGGVLAAWCFRRPPGVRSAPSAP